MRTVEKLNVPANENTRSGAYATGFNDGQAASLQGGRLSPYLRVGIDEYARGYRAGFYARATNQTAPVLEHRAPRQAAGGH